MDTRWMSVIRFSSVTVLLLVLLSALNQRAVAQEPITLSFSDENVVVQSVGPTSVNYDYNIGVTPADTFVACMPESGAVFEPGATRVDCTAGAGDQQVQGSFYVLVTNGDNTDVEIYNIFAEPFPVEPAGFLTYNVELRNIANATARQVVLTTTLPPAIKFLSSNNPNCNTRDLPQLTCTILTLNAGVPQGFLIRAQLNPGFTEAFQYTWDVSLGDNQVDLRADNNRFTVNTQVQVRQAPNRLFLPQLMES
ncbi:MAG: hypothetical protein HC822_01055 [Oscillochloris sp.]|nr:hypothetical protein [Oscillochloris sp.]